MTPNIHLVKEDTDSFHNLERYRRLVRKLNYLTVTCPDIAYTASFLNQFMFEPTVKHCTTF